VAEWEASRIVALVGRQNGAVEAWDIASGERLVRWKPDGVGFVRHLALSKTDRGPALLAAWSEGRFGIFDSVTEEGTLKVEAAAKGADEVSALCVTERNGANVCVTAHDSKRLVVRSLPALTPILEKADAGRIYDLRPVTGDLGNTFLSVGDFFRSKMEPPNFVSPERDPSVLKLWSSDDLSLVWEDRRNRDELLTHVEEAVLFGRKLILAFRAHGGPSEIWDFETRKLAFFDNRRTWRTWLYEFNGEPLLVSVLVERLFARRLARDADDRAFTLVAKDVGRPIVMPGEGFSNIFRLRGRASILNAVLDRVRVWDLDDLLTEATRDEKIDRTKAPEGIIVPRVGALVAAAGGELYGASRTKVFAVDAATGTLRWERDLGGTDPIVQLQLARNDEWLVAGTHAGVLHLLDGSSQGATLRTIQAGESLRRFECFRWRGLDLAFATVSARNVWAARLWDLNTGLELPTNEAFQLQWGEEDKPLTGLAIIATERAVRLAFASRYGKVMVARYDGTEPAKTALPRRYQEWPFPDAENEYIEFLATDTEGGETLLAAGSEEGRLAIWNFDNGEVKASHSQAHVGRVNALSFGNFLGQKVLVSGGADGTLRLWTLGLAELLRLDLGEPIGAIAPAGVERLAVGGEGGLAAFQFPKRGRRSSLDGL
jgi:WD40 repeat protein